MSEDPLLASPPLTLTSQIVQTTSRTLKRVRETVAEALSGGQDENDALSVKVDKSPGSGTPGLGTLDSLAAATEAAAAEAAAAKDADGKSEIPPPSGNVFDEVA